MKTKCKIGIKIYTIIIEIVHIYSFLGFTGTCYTNDSENNSIVIDKTALPTLTLIYSEKLTHRDVSPFPLDSTELYNFTLTAIARLLIPSMPLAIR
jgi:hypothetical protein